MQGNRKVLLVHFPESLEQNFSLGPGVDKDQRGRSAADLLINILCCIAPHVTGPWKIPATDNDFDLRRNRASAFDALNYSASCPSGRRQVSFQRIGISDRGRETDTAGFRSKLSETCQTER